MTLAFPRTAFALACAWASANLMWAATLAPAMA